MKKFDLTKPYWCRNSYFVRMTCTDARLGRTRPDGTGYPLIGLAYALPDGEEILCCWTAEGKYKEGHEGEHPLDLVNMEPRPFRVGDITKTEDGRRARIVDVNYKLGGPASHSTMVVILGGATEEISVYPLDGQCPNQRSHLVRLYGQ